MNNNFNEFGYKKVLPDDHFQFDCSCCGDCCRNVKGSVMLESLDLYRISRFLKMEMSEVALKYADTAFIAHGFPVLVLETKQHLDACVFLKSSRCSVHQASPRACRTYPIGIVPDNDNPGEWLSFMVSKNQHHFTGQQHRVKDWIDETFTTEDREFITADYTYAVELAKLINNIDKQHDTEILHLTLLFKYFAYDITKDFLPQYMNNMEQLKTSLKQLGG